MRPKRILITAGPTREKIDPVRFISNFSTGEMGYQIAEAALRRHHPVTLLTGAPCLEAPRKARTVTFESFGDLQKKLLSEFKKCDVLFMAAAVSDYTPAHKTRGKIKRSGKLNLTLQPTPDLLKGLLRLKKKQVVVGFCLETSRLKEKARRKLEEKKLDYIVGNPLSKSNQPFGKGKTTVLIMDRKSKSVWLEKKPKKFIADFLVRNLCSA